MRNGNGRRAPLVVEQKLSHVIRCAVYTRKSTDEGLQQDFNSLDAQREAGEAFIASQRGKGWQLVPEQFDDGGFTGSNMERPALKRLLAAVETRQINCVVVYKVDRLSRSLLDFARMMDLFDHYGASFASVTQNFNTTDSMGRLTLNILLSFAQFEREIISERTSDKMCAARKRGKWIGGHPVLGYDIDQQARRLVVNPDEAHQVKGIFDLYLDHGAMLPVLEELDRYDWRTKRWITQAGQARGGKPFTKSLLYGLLTNAIYTGRVNHKGTLYPGEHEAIMPRAIWEQVQDALDRNGRTNGGGRKNRYGALLRGLLFCLPCGEPMCHTYSAKGVKRYRYYVCYRAQQRGWKHCKTKSVSAPAYDEFIRQAAQGAVVHNDDTGMRILQLTREPTPKGKTERTGVFTSGIVSRVGVWLIALFFSGWKHAGENLAEVLKRRAPGLAPLIQMCDALSRNAPKLSEGVRLLLAYCLAHGRRQFVDVAANFPAECRYVLETLGGVWHNDELARKGKWSAQERLRFHQEHSEPLMKALKAWMEAQLAEHRTEPNSGLGKAIQYMLRHWEPLTLFLREPDAPLDNNLVERALKKAILHRKNSLFYKTMNGAAVGDLFMSLIHTCELNGANPFDYLTELQRHAEELKRHPAEWMPWNYRDTLARLALPAAA